jgi:predicted oxidoreductase
MPLSDVLISLPIFSLFRHPHTACFCCVLSACRQSLRELDTPYVDLLLLHAPGGAAKRPETWRALEEAVKEASIESLCALMWWLLCSW